ncbi:MAG: hypothetical protein E7036_05885 [Opitutales bacterium]|nr:hypothetical protein [Opitutales bacterium]
MKIKLFIVYLFTIITTYANHADKLCINFAKVLLGLEPDTHIAYVYINSYRSSKDIPKSKYNYIKAPNIQKFYKSYFPLQRSTVLHSYCSVSDSIIFIGLKNFSLSNIHTYLPLLRETKWLLILKNQYRDNKIIDSENIFTQKQISSLKEYKFINKETLFAIPNPQCNNGVCLQWDKDLFKIPSNIIQEKPTLVDDIAIMSSVLCAKQIDTSNVSILENLYGIKSRLQTKLGIKIYTEVCNILEANVIKSEFSPNKNSTLDFNEIERKLNKIK